VHYCLPCDAVFEKDLRICPDCGSRLLTDDERELWHQVQEDLTNQSFVPVHVLEGPIDEAILSELLSDADVAHIVRGGHGYDAFRTAFTAQEGWGVVLVPEDDIEKAHEIIHLYQSSQVVEEG